VFGLLPKCDLLRENGPLVILGQSSVQAHKVIKKKKFKLRPIFIRLKTGHLAPLLQF